MVMTQGILRNVCWPLMPLQKSKWKFWLTKLNRYQYYAEHDCNISPQRAHKSHRHNFIMIVSYVNFVLFSGRFVWPFGDLDQCCLFFWWLLVCTFSGLTLSCSIYGKKKPTGELQLNSVWIHSTYRRPMLCKLVKHSFPSQLKCTKQ